MSIYIETERLILREFTADDIAELHSICSQPYILKWMPDWEGTIEERMGWLSWIQSNYSKWTKDTARIMLAVTLKADKKLIGMVGIGNKEEVHNEIELAYFVSEKYSSKGYITEASKGMTQWVFDNLEMEYIIAIVETDNIPSQKVIEKCGFKKLDDIRILNSGDTEEKPFYYYRLYNEKH